MINRIINLFPPAPGTNGSSESHVILPLPAGQQVWVLEDYRDVRDDVPEAYQTQSFLDLYGPEVAVAIAVPGPDAKAIRKWGAQWATPAYVLVQRRLVGAPVLGALIPEWIRIADDQRSAVAAYFNEHDARRTLEQLRAED
jgi:hypothetical protein